MLKPWQGINVTQDERLQCTEKAYVLACKSGRNSLGRRLVDFLNAKSRHLLDLEKARTGKVMWLSSTENKLLVIEGWHIRNGTLELANPTNIRLVV